MKRILRKLYVRWLEEELARLPQLNADSSASY